MKLRNMLREKASQKRPQFVGFYWYDAQKREICRQKDKWLPRAGSRDYHVNEHEGSHGVGWKMSKTEYGYGLTTQEAY